MQKQSKSIFNIAAMLGLVFMWAALPAHAQDKKTASPAAKVTQTVGTAKINIDYSRPSVKGRKIWGELVPMGEVWRTGANSATVFETDKPVMIQGKELPAGKYALFTVPGEKEWTIIFNSDAGQWGAYKYDKAKDVLRVMAKPEKAAALTEMLTIELAADGKAAIVWENVKVPFMVKAK
jgi:Protein of unknown function (DUF2911)